MGTGGELGLEHPARVDRRVGVPLVVRREQRRDVDAEHPGERAQVAAGVEVAAAGREVVDLDRLDHVRPDAGALGELVDAEPEPGAGGDELGADDGVVGRLDRELVDEQRLDGVAGGGDRADPVAPDLGLLDQVHAAGTAQLAALGQLGAGLRLVGGERGGARRSGRVAPRSAGR